MTEEDFLNNDGGVIFRYEDTDGIAPCKKDVGRLQILVSVSSDGYCKSMFLDKHTLNGFFADSPYVIRSVRHVNTHTIGADNV